MPELSERASRRQAQREATLKRNEAHTRRQHKVAVWRRTGLIAGLAAVVAAVVVLVVVLATRSSPPVKPSGPTLTKQILTKVANASATAQGDGGAWITDDDRDLLLRFNPSTHRTGQSVHLDKGRPVDVLLSGSHLWVAEMVTNTVQEFDATTLALVRTISVPTGPAGLATLDGELWVASVDANDVTPINLTSGTAGTALAIPGGAVRIAAGFGSLWVTGTTNTLTPITPGDHGTGTVLPAITVGQAPIGVATGDGSVWVADSIGGTVYRIDPHTRSVTSIDKVGGNPLSLAVSGGKVYLADGSGQTVRVIYPTPASKKLNLDATPRLLLTVHGGIWVTSANPGRVFEVKPG